MILSQPLSPLPGEIRRAGREADQMLTPITRSRSSTGISSGPEEALSRRRAVSATAAPTPLLAPVTGATGPSMPKPGSF